MSKSLARPTPKWVPCRVGRGCLLLLVWYWGLGGGLGSIARGQAETAPVAAAPAPSVPEAPPQATSREAALEARVRQLEALIQRMPDPDHVRELESTVQRLSKQVEDLKGLSREPKPGERRPSRSSAGSASGTVIRPPVGGGVGSLKAQRDAPLLTEIGGEIISPAAPPPTSRFQMPPTNPFVPLEVHFGPGFEMGTDNEEFLLEFHTLTQFDGRFYEQGGQQPVADTFGFPREWIIFNGRVTKPIEYYISFAQGFTGFDLLDTFINLAFDPRFQFRVGRYKTPFAYEFYAEPTPALANGEWSLFFNNFALNRDSGIMGWGQLFQDRLDYAIGTFNSTANGQVDLSDLKDVVGFLNFAPFETKERSILENFNIGGSVDYGQPNHMPIPSTLRTIVPTTGNSVLGVPFLDFNANVLESGPKALWTLHAAWYYKSFMIIGEWQSGFQNYALTNQLATRTRVPIDGFYVQAAYLLTGEHAASRNLVQPLKPFDPRKGRWGPGAWEIAARYSDLRLGNQVFTGGLADPSIWTNQLYATDLGLSWYWNQYFRILFDWQHAGFGSPVLYRPGALQKTSDLFLIRFQIFF